MTLSDLDQEQLLSNNIEVKNIVAKLDLGVELDLSYLSSQLPNSSYEPERYPSLIFRSDDIPTVLVTNSGILLFTGAKSIESIYGSYENISNRLYEIGLDDLGDTDEIQIVNIVSIFEFDSKINLNHLSIRLGLEKVEYEPEQFPGLVYRIDDGPVALIFSSGKVVITGAVSTNEIVSATDSVRAALSN